MEIIYLSHPYQFEKIYPHPVVMALGFFDGVHLGHQAVIKRAKTVANEKNIPLALMTFNQHPKIIYQKINPNDVQYLTTVQRKINLMEELDVDILYIIEYSIEFGTQTPQEFVDKYIVGLQAQVVVAGFDYTYGQKEVANMTTLVNHSRGRFEIVEVSEKTMHQHKIGSSTIKELIQEGKINQANQELGYIYQTSGTVIHGDKRGRTIGFPTANVKTNPQELLPAIGVYVVEFWVNNQWWLGMASIGYNITFSGIEELRCEVNILDFNEDIYGQEVKIRWHHYLRNEIKFEGLEGLIGQLEQDEINTKNYFK